MPPNGHPERVLLATTLKERHAKSSECYEKQAEREQSTQADEDKSPEGY